MEDRHNPLVEEVITILRRGEPIPLDLLVRLLEEGIDVSELEEKYSL